MASKASLTINKPAIFSANSTLSGGAPTSARLAATPSNAPAGTAVVFSAVFIRLVNVIIFSSIPI